jgi:hypothetical protein
MAWDLVAALTLLMLSVISIQLESIKSLLKALLAVWEGSAVAAKVSREIPYADIVAVIRALFGKS